MTAKQCYEATLIELNKENAPNITLEDFNYLFNKAINQYVNKRYNIYDINQQTTDDLRVLKATAVLKPEKVKSIYDSFTNSGSMATYEIILPSDYLHMLNCICLYVVDDTYKCYNKGDHVRAAATRLTADAYSQVLDNFWNKPDYNRPYYYIHNVNNYKNSEQFTENERVIDNEVYYTDKFIPTNDKTDAKIVKTSYQESKHNKDSWGNNLANVESINLFTGVKANTEELGSISNVERGSQIRYGNASEVRCEIRYGTDDSVFKLEAVYIDYLKAPQNIRLTQKQIDKTIDTSQMLEYPDYVCQEIINELVHIIMENIGDGRLNTHPVVSQSIANPVQQQTEPVAQPQ